MKTKTRTASLTLAIIGLLVLTGCLRPLSSKQSSESASAAATIAAAKATEAAAVQIIAQATQNAQRPVGPRLAALRPPSAWSHHPATQHQTATPVGTANTNGSSCGADILGNEYDCSPGQGPLGPVPMPPGRGTSSTARPEGRQFRAFRPHANRRLDDDTYRDRVATSPPNTERSRV